MSLYKSVISTIRGNRIAQLKNILCTTFIGRYYITFELRYRARLWSGVFLFPSRVTDLKKEKKNLLKSCGSLKITVC